MAKILLKKDTHFDNRLLEFKGFDIMIYQCMSCNHIFNITIEKIIEDMLAGRGHAMCPKCESENIREC